MASESSLFPGVNGKVEIWSSKLPSHWTVLVASGWAAYTHIWPKVKYFNLFYLQIYNDKIKAWRIKTLDHFFVFFFIVTSLVGSLMNDQLFLHLVSSTQQSYLELSQRVDCQLDWVWYIDKQAWAECVGFFFAFVLLCFFCFFSQHEHNAAANPNPPFISTSCC